MTQFASREPSQTPAQLIVMPRFAPRIYNHARLGPPKRVRHEGETRVGENRPRLQHAPRPNCHCHGADSEHRARTFAKDKRARRLRIDRESLDTLKHPDA